MLQFDSKYKASILILSNRYKKSSLKIKNMTIYLAIIHNFIFTTKI